MGTVSSSLVAILHTFLFSLKGTGSPMSELRSVMTTICCLISGKMTGDTIDNHIGGGMYPLQALVHDILLLAK
jgi:hypothetical protein